MFKVAADGLEGYFNFDPARKPDLQALDRLIGKAAPGLAPDGFRTADPAVS